MSYEVRVNDILYAYLHIYRVSKDRLLDFSRVKQRLLKSSFFPVFFFSFLQNLIDTDYLISSKRRFSRSNSFHSYRDKAIAI